MHFKSNQEMIRLLYKRATPEDLRETERQKREAEKQQSAPAAVEAERPKRGRKA